MRSSRRSSNNVNLSSYNVADQQRELARLFQEKTDRELAAQLQREINGYDRRARPSRDARTEDERHDDGAPGPAPPNPARITGNVCNCRNCTAREAPGPIRNTSRRNNRNAAGREAIQQRAARGRRSPSSPSHRRTVVVRNSAQDYPRNFEVVITHHTQNRSQQPDSPPSRERHVSDDSTSISDLSDEDEEDEEEENDSFDDFAAGGFEPVVNHIAQPLLGNDVAMYERELELHYPAHAPLPTTSAAADAVYNPPPRVGTPTLKWGECNICMESPIDPKGCGRCMKLIGCAECVSSWHRTSEQPACPLCRRQWGRAPDVLSMKTIDRRLKTRDRLHSERKVAEREAATNRASTSTQS